MRFVEETAARGVKVLTDEAVAVTPGGAIEGFTRPVHLRARHDMVLEGWTPFGSTEGFEMLGAPKAPGGPHEPATALVAILDRRNEGSTRAVEFNRLSKADSARLLAANAFNLLETGPDRLAALADWSAQVEAFRITYCCLLYTSDAADERSSVDLGGRRIIKKKKRSTIQ